MKILVVDDEVILRKGIVTFLKNQSYEIEEALNGKEALQKLGKEEFDLIISDVQMPELNGIELLKELRNRNIVIPFIIITAFAKVEDAVLCMKLGANDYLTKPINLEELKIKISKIEKQKELERENTELKRRLDEINMPAIIGESRVISDMKNMIRKVAADSNVSVMIYGENGTGKELVARNVHGFSERGKHPFVAINCAAVPDELLESELFGYVKGAFTGAAKDKIGYFELANEGTIFLDEVSEMSPAMQAKLLRVLQDHHIQPLGSTQAIHVDIRVIGASNKKLDKLVKQNKFREDLYYRLNVVEINVPALRNRVDDIPLLINYFLSQKEKGRRIIFSKEALNVLEKYAWPGNIRELENLIKMLMVTTELPVIEISDLPEKVLTGTDYSSKKWMEFYKVSNYQTALHNAIANFEKEYLLYHIKMNKSNISKTAEAINLSRVSLYKKINEHNLKI